MHEKELIQSEAGNIEKMKARTEKHYELQLKSLGSQIKDQEDRLSKLSVSMAKEEAFQTLKDDGMLTERLNRLKNVEIPMAKEYNDSKRINKFQDLEKITHKELQIIIPKEEQITKDIFLSDELTITQNKLETQINEIEQKKAMEIQELDAKISELDKKLKNQKYEKDF